MRGGTRSEVEATAESSPSLSPSQRPSSAGMRFDNRVALITGASDRGIGGAIAERLASEGAAVMLASRSTPRRLLKRLSRSQHGAEWTQCDVTDPDDIRGAVDACMENYGQIDVLVNNAGIEQVETLEQADDVGWRNLLDVNLTGVVQFTKTALRHMTAPGGVVVNISSALAIGGCAGFSVYSASKAGLDGFTQSLAWELAPSGIRVVGVAPGLVLTEMVSRHLARLTPEAAKQIEACHPLGVGSPHDVASGVAFLASDEARWITGVTLPMGYAPGYPLPTQMMTGHKNDGS